jgi:hypothetical protein
VRVLVLLLVLIGHLGLTAHALAAGVPWHAQHGEGHDHAWSAPDDRGADAEDAQGCDHGCHASAHLLGVLADQPGLFFPHMGTPRAGDSGPSHSHIPPPPVRPPRYAL